MAVDVREIPPSQTAVAYEAIVALRPHVESREQFAQRVDTLQRPEGYRLVGAFADGRCVAVAGFRAGHSLAWGSYLYVDDLVTHPDARGAGHARALMDWLLALARELGCDQLHLDSGVGPQRTDAHRLYLNAGLQVASLHFARELGASD